MIKGSFHNHTTYSDGKNTPREMIEEALRLGLTSIGISDHSYTAFDIDYCMSPESEKEYIAEIRALKEEYKDRINVLLGIELDYYTGSFPSEYDYIIGSLHYLDDGKEHYSVDLSPEEALRCINNVFNNNKYAYAEAYFEKIADFVCSGKINVIGHFNLITKYEKSGLDFDKDNPVYVNAWKKAMDRMAGKAILEINTGAIKYGRKDVPYPSEDMLTYWNSLGGKVIYSADAHYSDALMQYSDMVEEMIFRLGLTRAESPLDI
ncbi:MAG: histidinol-phosphatase HisJ family protein [Parasporobacterium sp.]|nr:histidinol-phosphatase HisJ family protein [Parasporobacterium sp.]